MTVTPTIRWGPRRRGPAVAALLLPLCVLFVFWPVFGTYFSQDDFGRLERARLFSLADVLRTFLRFGDAEFYRPTIECYFFALVRLFGPQIGPFHIAAVVLTILNAALLARLARALGMGTAAAGVAAYGYACHSALLTGVLWPSAANSPLCVAFILGALLAAGSDSRWKRIGIGWSCGILALASREIAVLLPALVVLALTWRQANRGTRITSALRRAWRPSLPYWGLLGLYGIAKGAGIRQLASDGAPYELAWGPHLARNAADVLRFAAGVTGTAGPAGLWVAGALWIVFVIAVGRRRPASRSQPLPGLLWLGLGVTPILALHTHRLEPYYLDVALLGLALGIAALCERVERERPIGRLAVPLALLLFVGWQARETRLQYAHSLVRERAERAERLLADLRRIQPRFPVGSRLRFVAGPAAEDLRWTTGWGALFRVAFDDPRLQIEFVEGDAAEPAGDSPRTLFTFEVRDGRLRGLNPR